MAVSCERVFKTSWFDEWRAHQEAKLKPNTHQPRREIRVRVHCYHLPSRTACKQGFSATDRTQKSSECKNGPFGAAKAGGILL